MNKTALIGRVFFAISLVAFGIQQFLFGDFVPGRAPAWPAALPGRLVFAYLTGAVLIGAGLAIVLRRKAREAAVLAGLLVFVWAFLRNVPLALADAHYGGAWTNLGKGLALFGGALAVAGSLPQREAGFLYVGRFCLGAFLISSGIQHFLFAEFVDSLVPTWMPPNARGKTSSFRHESGWRQEPRGEPSP